MIGGYEIFAFEKTWQSNKKRTSFVVSRILVFEVTLWYQMLIWELPEDLRPHAASKQHDGWLLFEVMHHSFFRKWVRVWLIEWRNWLKSCPLCYRCRSSRTGFCCTPQGVTWCGTVFLGVFSLCLSTPHIWETSPSITLSWVSKLAVLTV